MFLQDSQANIKVDEHGLIDDAKSTKEISQTDINSGIFPTIVVSRNCVQCEF